MRRTSLQLALPYAALILAWVSSVCAIRPLETTSVNTVAQSEYEASWEYLVKNIPQEDRKLGDQYMRENIDLALAARYSQEWASAVPLEIFLNYVLPYANVDEPRERWRPMFRNVLEPLILDAKSISEAAVILNRDIWRLWGIHFKADQTPEIMAPSEVIATGYASCTGLSIFLVNACRSVGIPARVAGIPSWNTPDQGGPERFNNHNWVEIWDNGVWSFTGAAEYTPEGFNHTWFFPGRTAPSLPGDQLHAIYAASFAPTPSATYFPLAWNPDYQGVHAYDVTQYYLDAAKADNPSAAGKAAPAKEAKAAKATKEAKATKAAKAAPAKAAKPANAAPS